MPARRPTLDYRPAGEAEQAAIEPLLESGWLTQDLEKLAETYALQHLVPHMLEDVRTRRLVHVDKVEREVESRLKRAIMHWHRRAEDLKVQEQAGKKTRLPSCVAARRAGRGRSDQVRRRQGPADPGGRAAGRLRAVPGQPADGLGRHAAPDQAGQDQGEEGAARLARQLGYQADMARDLAYRL